MTVTFTHEIIFEDGGYQATVNVYGQEFHALFVEGEIRMHGNASQYRTSGRTRGIRKTGSEKAKAAIAARIEALGPEFMAKHRALYELN